VIPLTAKIQARIDARETFQPDNSGNADVIHRSNQLRRSSSDQLEAGNSTNIVPVCGHVEAADGKEIMEMPR